tara:strand:+ start:39632 stop:39919 length:288 start_codon:yes stop_codon:yes gene_type:complete
VRLTAYDRQFRRIDVEKTLRTKMISTGPIVLRKSSNVYAGNAHLPETEPKRVHARAIKRILDRQSGEVVGWLYEWNTGALVPRWKADAHKDVIYD